MNRTISAIGARAATDKLTENTLSDEIYDNLRVLSFMHPFSDEMNTIFEKVNFHPVLCCSTFSSFGAKCNNFVLFCFTIGHVY